MTSQPTARNRRQAALSFAIAALAATALTACDHSTSPKPAQTPPATTPTSLYKVTPKGAGSP